MIVLFFIFDIERLYHHVFYSHFLYFRYLGFDIFVPGRNAIIKNAVLNSEICRIAISNGARAAVPLHAIRKLYPEAFTTKAGPF